MSTDELRHNGNHLLSHNALSWALHEVAASSTYTCKNVIQSSGSLLIAPDLQAVLTRAMGGIVSSTVYLSFLTATFSGLDWLLLILLALVVRGAMALANAELETWRSLLICFLHTCVHISFKKGVVLLKFDIIRYPRDPPRS